jgi:hypothetical protein
MWVGLWPEDYNRAPEHEPYEASQIGWEEDLYEDPLMEVNLVENLLQRIEKPFAELVVKLLAASGTSIVLTEKEYHVAAATVHTYLLRSPVVLSDERMMREVLVKFGETLNEVLPIRTQYLNFLIRVISAESFPRAPRLALIETESPMVLNLAAPLYATGPLILLPIGKRHALAVVSEPNGMNKPSATNSHLIVPVARFSQSNVLARAIFEEHRDTIQHAEWACAVSDYDKCFPRWLATPPPRFLARELSDLGEAVQKLITEHC